MKKLYLVTGANGHLGGTLLRLLKKQSADIRGLILPSEQPEQTEGVQYIRGDVRDLQSLRPLFEGAKGREVICIHTAGIIDISDQVSPLAYDVNVNGTKNILALCREYKVSRLLYVSSVHAIPEGDKSAVLHEVSHFSPDEVVGGYAKTKAEATQAVLDAAQAGLDAVVVHPSGILGPYDRSGNHLVQLVTDYIKGKLPACVRGGYDLVARRGHRLPAGPGEGAQRPVLYPLQPPLRDQGPAGHGAAPDGRAPAAGAPPVDGKGRVARHPPARQAHQAPPPVHPLFPVHPAQQRQIFP